LPLSGKGFIIGCQSPCRGGEKLLAVEGKLRDSEIEIGVFSGKIIAKHRVYSIGIQKIRILATGK